MGPKILILGIQAILKRMLKVSHPMLQLHVLKLLKSQVPYCGRKWRQCMVLHLERAMDILTVILANMKVITSIYLNCRPDLRDEWLTGTEVEDVQGALVSLSVSLVMNLILPPDVAQAQETALRTLIKFCEP